MVANDGQGVYEILVVMVHIAFAAFLLGSAVSNLCRLPWFVYGEEPKPAVQRWIGAGELVLAAVISLPYFWQDGAVAAVLVALAYGVVLVGLAFWHWRQEHAVRLATLVTPAVIALAFAVLALAGLAGTPAETAA
ncbi:hypothetical protein D477_021558 [Arthrobacter crystallopoietes BAB-32]|uniref:Integral membrane protein n=1 Tax=Arthrobacter crystallopoietes BAB-32 TaxID=1246476 RepID=N1USX0_9MICC|nr:hypothetical protein [Arthrobacter crystallopoietes]EMY32165.1 hypothetical protein D477_021558 [Arthrobacter crystallopoietes BAB-32]